MATYYTYYSYEEKETGRGYIGYRKCPDNLKIHEDYYLGSYSDKSFNPTSKIIIGIYSTQKEAVSAEADLHELYNVDTDPHFANKVKQSSYWFHNNKGKNLSMSHKNKISKSLKGRPSPNKGKTFDETWRKNLSIGIKKAGERNPKAYKYWEGRTHSDSTKKKLSERSKGSKNPAYKGIKYCWYNKRTKVKEHHKTILEMKEKYPEITNKIYYVPTGVVKSHKGWVIVNCDNLQPDEIYS